jgi:ABC-type nitrate/sulfonate/bicarbonate transport system substrate-binding protein
MKRLLAALLYCVLALGMPVPAPADDAGVVRVGTTPIDPGAEAYYADEMGFFNKDGLKATVQTLPNALTVIAALMSGNLDIGFVGINNEVTPRILDKLGA